MLVPVHVTVLLPSGNVDGDAGVHVIVTGCSEASVAVAVYDEPALGELPVVLKTRFAGHVIVGGGF
jgi:hypothetical protein